MKIFSFIFTILQIQRINNQLLKGNAQDKKHKKCQNILIFIYILK
jgi:hypothetical protein